MAVAAAHGPRVVVAVAEAVAAERGLAARRLPGRAHLGNGEITCKNRLFYFFSDPCDVTYIPVDFLGTPPNPPVLRRKREGFIGLTIVSEPKAISTIR